MCINAADKWQIDVADAITLLLVFFLSSIRLSRDWCAFFGPFRSLSVSLPLSQSYTPLFNHFFSSDVRVKFVLSSIYGAICSQIRQPTTRNSALSSHRVWCPHRRHQRQGAGGVGNTEKFTTQIDAGVYDFRIEIHRTRGKTRAPTFRSFFPSLNGHLNT